jgi:hypothetical protein
VHLQCPLNFFIVVLIYWKPTSYRSSLDLLSFDKTTNRSIAKSSCSFFLLDRRARYSTCRWLQDFVMTLSRSLRLHIARGLVRHGYPWVPTDQAHGRPRQVGPAYYKTRRPVSGSNRPSWLPTRRPEDLPEESPDDLPQTRRLLGVQDKTVQTD